MSNCLFDSFTTQITKEYWDDLLLRTVRSCITDNNRHVLFINDAFFTECIRDVVLSDINELLNNGGLSIRLFTYEIVEELIDKVALSSYVQISDLSRKFLAIHSFLPSLGILPLSSCLINFVETFCFIFERRKDAIRKRQKRYELGLEKVVRAEQQIRDLQSEIARLQPELMRTSTETSILMSRIEQETIEMENAREIVAADEARANAAATNAQTLKSESEQELADAMPALDSAIDALHTLNHRDISTLKSMRYPPRGVRLCMEAVCILLDEAPVKTVDSLGHVTMDYWVKGQKVLSDLRFLTRIRNFEKDTIPAKTIDIIRKKYLSMDEFDPEVSSLAAEGLCLWVKAIDAYDRIATIVAPKREKLKAAERYVKKQMKQLDLRRKALQEVTEHLQSLSDSFSRMSQRKQELLLQIQSCEQRMTRIQRLVVALGGEKDRWQSQLFVELNDELERAEQNALLGSIAIEYLSAYTSKSRNDVLDKIREHLGIMEAFNLQMICDGERPSENAIMLENSRRVPLIINSRGEAKSFLRQLHADRLLVVDVSERRLPSLIQNAITSGTAVLVESLQHETIPPFILSVLTFHIISLNKQQFVIFDGKKIAYNDAFRLYLCTDKPRTSFSAAFLSKIVPIECAMSDEEIHAKLWQVIYSSTAPALQKRSKELSEEKVRLDQQLAKCEQNLLTMLANVGELEDERAIELLSESKQLNLESDSVTVKFLLRPIFLTLAKVDWQKLRDLSKSDCETSTIDIFKAHLAADYHTPIALIVRQESLSVLRMLEQLMGSRKSELYMKSVDETMLHVHSVTEDLSKIPISTIMKSGEWILFEDAHLVSSAQLQILEEILSKIKNAQNINQAFRVFFSIYSDEQPQPFLDHCQLIAIEIPNRLPDFIRYCYDNGPATEISDRLDTDDKRSQLYRICLLHFAIRQRCRYGIYGWSKPFEVGDVELQLSLHLFRDLAASQASVAMGSLRINVLDLVYLSRIDNDYDQRVFWSICDWLFDKTNAMIEGIIPKSFWTSHIIHHSDTATIKSYMLSGLNENVEKVFTKKRFQKMASKIHIMFGVDDEKQEDETLETGTEETEVVENDEVEVTGSLFVQCIQQELNSQQRSAHRSDQSKQLYLTSLLSQTTTIDTVDVSQMERPSALIAALRLEYSAKQEIGLEQVVCCAQLSKPAETEVKYTQFVGCVLLGCRYDEANDELLELQTSRNEQDAQAYQQLKAIWIRADRKSVIPDETIPITVHDRHSLEAILEVNVHSKLPLAHWLLRGARILTYSPS
ncbi:unnamed protein product [Anisakis simplex]|uniref:Uncharacterized protein n=1 Tax=Anisakis simplex TaxID=6269 RepID=A0A3P6SAU0_ANISI|nr:unnamed protein product [Anisakis simplex]